MMIYIAFLALTAATMAHANGNLPNVHGGRPPISLRRSLRDPVFGIDLPSYSTTSKLAVRSEHSKKHHISSTNSRPPSPSGGGSAGTVFNEAWAGAIYRGHGISLVEADLIVPKISMPAGSSGHHAASLWVGIDGTGDCSNGDTLWQAGVDVEINGSAQYNTAWFELYPGPSMAFPEGLVVNAGDLMHISISSNDSSGTAIVTNKSTGKSVTHTLSTSETVDKPLLCHQSAEWIVEDAWLALPDYNTAKFDGAKAVTQEGIIDAAQAEALSSGSHGKIESRGSISGTAVIVEYVGPR